MSLRPLTVDEGVLGSTCAFDLEQVLGRPAVHAAAHVVASHWLGRPSRRDVGLPPGGLHGPCDFSPVEPGPRDRDRSDAEASEFAATTLVIAAEAEAIIFPQAGRRPCAEADAAVAREFLLGVDREQDEIGPLLEAAQARARAIVREPRVRSAIVELADATIDAALSNTVIAPVAVATIIAQARFTETPALRLALRPRPTALPPSDDLYQVRRRRWVAT